MRLSKDKRTPGKRTALIVRQIVGV
ncbi:protein of unknown function [Acidithiobacillus ferrivorans]|uniref:Uncharacterized protein n=1 Tax=Acidithiobacillus ferrivorans TaxID=160808 RepID=A0A060UVK1_9PROT|nr:hypothetical protein AFERRI_400355 [Acidithiobacillus ferrivorans]SMH64605.1 protein of unknown function [Acidithiobacillus ferrivorans]